MPGASAGGAMHPGGPPLGSFAPPKPPLSPGGSQRTDVDGTLAEMGGPALFKPASMRDASEATAAAAAATGAKAQQAAGGSASARGA